VQKRHSRQLQKTEKVEHWLQPLIDPPLKS